MKALKNTLIAAVFVAGASALGTASALTLDSIPGVNGSALNVQIEDGIATIFGQVDSGAERELVHAYVEKMENVDQVIDLVTFN